MNRIKNQPATKLPKKNTDNSVNFVSKTTPLVSALLDWFATNSRDLPWRHTRDPYAIWVSEIMLQQTQVKTVIAYWERWMRELPTIESLAHASTDKIHKLWEGLGYYTRVRNMQKAAQQILAEYGGKFPHTFDAVLALPGIGRYTAGAICSIAFNQPTPIIDGNVMRVLTRVYGIKTDPREKETKARLWQLAEDLVVDAKNAEPTTKSKHKPLPSSHRLRADHCCSHLNQSLMELGALICSPRSPDCAACPVQNLCVAKKENLQAHLPNSGKRAATTEHRFLAFVIEYKDKYLIRQRPSGVVNAHLWEFPNVELPAESLPEKAFSSEFKAKPAMLEKLCMIKHSITRYRITLEAYRVRLPSKPKTWRGVWRTAAECESLAFTSAHKKIRSKLWPAAETKND